MSNHGPRTVQYNAARVKAYDEKKKNLLFDLQKLVQPESWPSVESSLAKASPETLQNTDKYARKALLEGHNKDNWNPDGVTVKTAVKLAVGLVLDHARPSKTIEGLGTTVEDTSGAATDEGTGSDTNLTIFVPPPPPSASPPASPSPPPAPEASSGQRPQKRLKLSNQQLVDLTADLSSKEEEQQRKSSLDLVDGRAKRIISELTENKQLHDDTIDITSQALKLRLPSSKAPIQILDTTQFDVDGEAIPSKLNNGLNWDEDIYAPLHHRLSRHWTLCVMVLKSDYKSGSEAESVSKSVCIDFYDSWEDKTRRERVETFFNKWIKRRYPEHTIRFNSKKSAQQADGTSCGIFALETIRRLIESQDVTDTIEPMVARRSFLDMINSLDTTSPPLSTTWQVIERIQALRNNCNKSAITAASPSSTQQPQSMLSSQYIITQIEALMAREGTSITDQLPRAQEKCRQLAEQEQRYESELKDAEKELAIAIIREEAFEEMSRTVAESTRADDTVNPWLAGAGRRAREYENTPLANDDRNTHGEKAEKARSGKDGVLLDQIHSLVQEAVQAELDDRNEMITEGLKKTLRAGSERVESAKKKVDGLKELLEGVKAEKFGMDSIVGVCLGSLRQKCGGETKVP